MIATGGLLRINARRQDSLKTKTQKAHPHKKRSKKKRRSEVVVVKGKLKLFSVSGLVAALGILVLLVGVVMAALGYWPRDGFFFSAQPQEGAAMASVSTSRPTPAPTGVQVGETGEDEDEEDRGGGADEGAVAEVGLNQTEVINGTSGRPLKSFLEDFLDRYLYSDRLKVFGPLIMGIGIFLFICANAVLHENRDKKTKVINLRDIYSTVIDLHSLRKPNVSSGSAPNPLNGLINYVQSKSLETKPRSYPASLMTRKEGKGSGETEPLSRQPLPGYSSGGGACDTEGGGALFSIYQDEAPPSPSPSDRLSLPPSLSPILPSLQKEALSSFTLPLRRPRLAFPRRVNSARAGTGRTLGLRGEEDLSREEGCHKGEETEEEKVLGSSTTPPFCHALPAISCSSSSLHRGAPGSSQAFLLLSCSSLSSLSQLLSSTPDPSCRRRSLPCVGATGYSKLTHREGESFESAEMTSSLHMASGGQRSGEVMSHRKVSNREKLRMMSLVNDQSEAESVEEAQGRI